MPTLSCSWASATVPRAPEATIMQASGKEPSTGSSSAPITEALLGKSSSIFSAPRLVILADATISRPYSRISRIDEDRLLAQGKKSA